MTMEHKFLAVDRAEFKFDGDAGTFTGYASVFGGTDSYGDTIAPGAYSKTLTNRDRRVRMHFNHYGAVIGKWLSMDEDDKGLLVRGSLTPGHSVANDVLASLRHGAIDGLSIGFYARDFDEDDEGRRVLKEIELIEISVVEEPADNAARIDAVKSATSLKDIEKLLHRECVGVSQAFATMLVSQMKAILRSESEGKRPDAAAIAGVLQRFNLRDKNNVR